MKPTPFGVVVMTAVLATVVAACAPARAADDPAAAQNWPRFRGPDGTGLSDADIPAQWTAKDYNWKIELPGGGHSSPVVWGERLFLTCFDAHANQELIVCVNTADGAILWKHPYPTHTFPKHPDNSYATSTPALDATHVFVCWSTPEQLTLAALDHEGKELWTKDLGPFISQHGGGQSPVAFDNKVFLADDNEGPQSYLFGFDGDSGKMLWKLPRGHSDKFSPATPLVYRPAAGSPQIIFASKAHGLTAVDPTGGQKIWELPNVFDSRTVGSPFLADGLIIATCGDGGTGHGLVAAKPADDGRSAAVQYDIHRAVPYVPTPIVKDHLLYYWTDGGMITCAQASTGIQVWKHRLDANFFGSPVCAQNKMFCISREGEVFVIAASDHFELLAQNKLDLEDPSEEHPPLATTPAIAGGRMYIRTFTHLVSIGGMR